MEKGTPIEAAEFILRGTIDNLDKFKLNAIKQRSLSEHGNSQGWGFRNELFGIGVGLELRRAAKLVIPVMLVTGLLTFKDKMVDQKVVRFEISGVNIELPTLLANPFAVLIRKANNNSI